MPAGAAAQIKHMGRCMTQQLKQLLDFFRSAGEGVVIEHQRTEVAPEIVIQIPVCAQDPRPRYGGCRTDRLCDPGLVWSGSPGSARSIGQARGYRRTDQ